LTRDQFRINGFVIFEPACRAVAGATASGGVPGTSKTEYTGIGSSNQHLVSCDSTFNLPTPPSSWIVLLSWVPWVLYRFSSYGALCAPLIAGRFSRRTAFSASL